MLQRPRGQSPVRSRDPGPWVTRLRAASGGHPASSPGLASEELGGQPVSEGPSPCRHALNPALLQGQQPRGPHPGPGHLARQERSPLVVSVFVFQRETVNVSVFGSGLQPPGSSVHGFPRQGHWSGLPFPSPGDLPHPGIKPRPPARQADSLPLRHQGSPEREFVLICVAARGLGYVPHADSLVAEGGIQPLDGGRTRGPCAGSLEIQHWVTEGALRECLVVDPLKE